jgi:hypothetical protein
MPPVAQRELQDLTRYRRTFIQERVTLINRVQNGSDALCRGCDASCTPRRVARGHLFD